MAATPANWNEVWDGFNKRQKAKAGPVANHVLEGNGGNMFSRPGVAAE